MKKADWNGYRVGGRAAIAAGPFAEREAAVERLRQGPGPEAQPESAVPPSRWTLRTIRATFGVLHDYTLSGVWRWLRQDILKLHRLASDAKRLRQRVNNFLDQFAPGSRALLQYVGLLGEGQLAKAIPER